MRVIAGEFRSRALEAPRGIKTRPTSDRLRETLFNVLAPFLEGAVVADLYAGSGAIGIEALSRGARNVIFVEKAEPALKAIRSNLSALGIRGGYAIEARSVAIALRRMLAAGKRLNVVVLDPPYADAEEYALTLGLLGEECSELLAPDAVMVAEHEKRRELNERYGQIVRYRVLKQGDAALSFYRVEAGLTPPE
ncbi:16S rRNA (guanine(966)-N(2))-methyltransferase RsmD [Paracidobacterium acidisoli]|uniref:16S rRNA (Guanine(966)-N(2))-methyltransferase RsmD n=1 Tax=Paracidobacterium acidisoli TaxID=2303751 RepID=A0A372IM33_9BACT|nr:16S rRNA (guanine(966)-N(2))-methyltransferase RsmD [Paracidobacterium acidisoli]MBT9332554.1 16S rRNA (guanine(966)-N(2))-methyltransferase RsmD [Paracidobacterium acidisoli]